MSTLTVAVCRLAFLWRGERIGPCDLTLYEYDLVSAFVEGYESYSERKKGKGGGVNRMTQADEEAMYGGEVELDYDHF